MIGAFVIEPTRKGTTLIEVVVAIGLTGLIIILALMLLQRMRDTAIQTEYTLEQKWKNYQLIKTLTLAIEGIQWSNGQHSLEATNEKLTLMTRVPGYGEGEMLLTWKFADNTQNIVTADRDLATTEKQRRNKLTVINNRLSERVHCQLSYYCQQMKQHVLLSPPFAVDKNKAMVEGASYRGYPVALLVTIDEQPPVTISFISKPL